MSFWHTRQGSRQRPKTFRSLSQIGENFQLFLRLPFYSKCFYRYEECSFDRPAKLFLLNDRKWSKKNHKRWKNFLRKTFLQNVPMDSWEAVWKPRWIFFDCQPADVFPLDIETKTICNLCKNCFPRKFLWNWESSFDNLAEIFLLKAQGFLPQYPK